MKHPAASPAPACATHGPYASSMAAAVSTTKVDTTKIMICRDSQACGLGALAQGSKGLNGVTDIQQSALHCEGTGDASRGMSRSWGLRSVSP